jgi:O-antigen/teichoic acid export membrane protein
MRRKLTSGAPALALTYFASEFCVLARMALFAHVLIPASMGMVVILGTWLRLVEMVTDLSIERYLLRASDGASRAVQRAAHGTSILRGTLGSLFMAVSLPPLLLVYDIQGQLWAFVLVALVPFIRGFTHLDYRLHNRMLRIGSTAAVEISSSLAGLAVATSVFLLPGVIAFAVALLTQAIVAVLLSHVLASRRYEVSFDAEVRRRLWLAGWPLAVNAMFLYAVFQGERLMIGGIMGLSVLGAYAITAQLALLPVMIAGRLSIGLGLPVLARTDAHTARGRQLRHDVLQLFVIAGTSFWFGFVALAPIVTFRLFGTAYAQLPADLSWIAAAAALRLQKTGPATLLLASGRARDIMSGNSARLVGFGIGALGMFLTRDLTVFLAAAAVGEAVSCAIAANRAAPGLRSILLPLPLLAMAGVQAAWPYSTHAALPVALLIATASTVVLLRMAGQFMRPGTARLQQAGG